jgi:hypothetical protein
MLREFGHGFSKGFWAGSAGILAVAVVITVFGIGFGGGSSAAAEIPTPRHGQAKVFASPRQGYKIAPRGIELTGLEGRPLWLSGLGWSTWGGAKAKGYGGVTTVRCGTNCSGPGRALAVRVVLVRLNRSCGRFAYRKAFIFVGREGQYLPIACGSRSH